MSILQLLAGGPWMLWLTKLLFLLELVLCSRDWTRDLAGFYHAGPSHAIAVAVGFGLCLPICLNGIYEGFERGNGFGLVTGLLGLWFLGRGALAIFLPHYVQYLPF